MLEPNELNLLVAFGAGLVSFISPCVLPLIPTYIAYLAGVSVSELTDSPQVAAGTRRRLAVNALGFIAGFSLVFVLLGLSASTIGQFLLRNQTVLRRVGGVVIVVMGLHTMGVLRIGALYREKRAHFTGSITHPLSAFVFGVAFSAGWTPCIGPILASILVVAGSSGSVGDGAGLLLSYSLGLGLPFFLTALFFGSAVPRLGRLTRHMRRVSFIAGVLLVILGIMVYTNSFARLAGWLQWSL